MLLIWVMAKNFLAIASATPIPMLPVDTATYHDYSYIRFLGEKETAKLTDEEFYDLAGKVIFPINKYDLPKRDSLIMELRDQVFPLINRDSLELVYLMIRGATSPEGPYRFNKYLGERRAQTLLEFIKANLAVPINEDIFNMEFDVEDYRTLCLMMKRRSDKDYAVVQTMCDLYLPRKNFTRLKTELHNARQGTLWRRLLRDYFPQLRAARLVFFFRQPRTYAPKVLPIIAETIMNTPGLKEILKDTTTTIQPDMGIDDLVVGPFEHLDVEPTQPAARWIRQPRRELLSVKTNLLLDFAYVPGYDRWCPIPNVAVEFYPKGGHFTFGASFDCPWWQHYDDHKFFQIRNYQLESRYYFRPGSRRLTPPGEGAAFRGLYLQAYAHVGLYSICFDADRGWEGEGFGGGLGLGYVMPISRTGHWRLDFGAQFGYFVTKYDPYLFEHPVYTNYHDNLYYYKWTLNPDLFRRRAHQFTWFGPTRLGVTLSYDLLYRREEKKGISFKPFEWIKQE